MLIFIDLFVLPFTIIRLEAITPHELILQIEDKELKIVFPQKYIFKNNLYSCKYSEYSSYHVITEEYKGRGKYLSDLRVSLIDFGFTLTSNEGNIYYFTNLEKSQVRKYKLLFFDKYVVKLVAQSITGSTFKAKYQETFFEPMLISK